MKLAKERNAKETLIDRARKCAINAHSALDHRRKYTNEPYQEHLASVASMVEGASGTPEMIAAAWLHDSVEDTATTLEDIEENFGSDVATLVYELTDVSSLLDGNREKRKALDRAHLAKASPDAKTIKLADLIDNARSIEKHDPRFAQTFMREKQLLLEVLKDGDSQLFAKADEIVRRYFSGRELDASEKKSRL